MRLNDIDGSYYTSFFCINLETYENPEQAIENNSSTFAHEFIHYLQDLILPYNIRVNLSNLRWFDNICQIGVQDKQIKRPFDIWNEDSRITRLQYDYTWGESKSMTKVWKIGDIIYDVTRGNGYDSYLRKNRTFDIYKYSLYLNRHKKYHLGAYDLLEYIAYKIEKKHYKVENLAPLPYSSVDLLFEKYELSHIPDDIRLCIAEFCLYNDNPIHLLIQNFLKNEDFIRNSKTLKYETIYANLLKGSFLTKDGVFESLTDKTNRRLTQLASDLDFIYGALQELSDWVSIANKFATEQLSNRFIFSDIYKMSTKEFEQFQRSVLSQIGLPLLMNRKEKRISLLPNDSDSEAFDQFYIACKLLYFLSSKKSSKYKSCPINTFCKENYNTYYKQCNAQLKLGSICCPDCPYAKFLKIFELENVKII